MVSNEKIDIEYNYGITNFELEEENRILKETINQLKNELERSKKAPLMLCDVREVIDKNNAVIRIPNGNQFFVEISDGCEKIKAGDSVLVEQKNLMIVKKARFSKRFNVDKFVIIEKPEVSWKDVGGLEEQIRELKEIIELPLIKPELFKNIGITPPKGILLHGSPGTGKTLLAKAVASSTNATFIEIVGSELVQKFIGEGAKLVKDIFVLAKEKAPSIIFIDELDAIAARRMEIGTSGEREVQRTFMQLLAEIDGFKHLGNVKVIGCTNRKDILDPAVIRPGRLERQIYVPIPNEAARKQIFEIHTARMNVERERLTEMIRKTELFSGADIKAVCTEAGYFAIRENRTKVTRHDFLRAIEKIRQKEEIGDKEYLSMFG